MQRCYDEVNNWSDGSTERIGASCKQFIEAYNRLRETATSDQLWKRYPKFHLMMHACESGVCPRSEWAYSDESEIGKASELAERADAGVIGTSLIERYRIGKYHSR